MVLPHLKLYCNYALTPFLNKRRIKSYIQFHPTKFKDILVFKRRMKQIEMCKLVLRKSKHKHYLILEIEEVIKVLKTNEKIPLEIIDCIIEYL
jgi:hypothetical protein